MKALLFERKVAKFAAAAIAGRVVAGRGAKHGPLTLKDVDPPSLPAAGWQRLRPRLAGICGSDLATIDGRSSRYFEPIVSFPFTLGHEVVGDLDDGTRAVLVPVLHCATRGIDPPCVACRDGQINRCERIAFGHLEPGLQSGFCETTGGGWSLAMVAHESQLLRVPADMSDEQAVMVEPTACAVHAARTVPRDAGPLVIVGAGALGLLTLAALRAEGDERTIVMTAKHPDQRRWAKELGADRVVEPRELARAVRSETSSLVFGDHLTGGAPTVVDCVGSEDSLADSLRVVAPGGTVLVVGMPGHAPRPHVAVASRDGAAGVLRLHARRLRRRARSRAGRRPRAARQRPLPARPVHRGHRARGERRHPRCGARGVRPPQREATGRSLMAPAKADVTNEATTIERDEADQTSKADVTNEATTTEREAHR
jgi:threonine dehydrogenase-like Zn-dependent dehydrogenase